MQFMRSNPAASVHQLAESFTNVDPRALVAVLLDIITRAPEAGMPLTVLRIVHEVDKWEIVGPDADRAYAEIAD